MGGLVVKALVAGLGVWPLCWWGKHLCCVPSIAWTLWGGKESKRDILASSLWLCCEKIPMGRKCKRVEIGASELRARPGLAWVSREVFILNSANMHFCPGVPCTVAGREESRLSKCRNESGLCSKKIEWAACGIAECILWLRSRGYAKGMTTITPGSRETNRWGLIIMQCTRRCSKHVVWITQLSLTVTLEVSTLLSTLYRWGNRGTKRLYHYHIAGTSWNWDEEQKVTYALSEIQ